MAGHENRDAIRGTGCTDLLSCRRHRQALRDAFAKQGMTPVVDKPERLAELVEQELARWSRVVAASNIRE